MCVCLMTHLLVGYDERFVSSDHSPRGEQTPSTANDKGRRARMFVSLGIEDCGGQTPPTAIDKGRRARMFVSLGIAAWPADTIYCK